MPTVLLEKHKRHAYDLDTKFGYIAMKVRSHLPVYAKQKKLIEENFEVISRNLFSLYNTIKPNICIVDGYTAMEGNGPWHGKKVLLNTVLISNNCFCADTVMSKIMGLDSTLLGYTKYIQSSFDEEIIIMGTDIKQCMHQFKKNHFTKEL